MKCSGTCSVTLTLSVQEVCVPYTTATTHVQTVISVSVALLMGLCGQPVGTDRKKHDYTDQSHVVNSYDVTILPNQLQTDPSLSPE